MTASEEVIKGAINGEKDEKLEKGSGDAKETTKESNESQSDKKEGSDVKDSNNNGGKNNKKKEIYSDLMIRVAGFPKLNDETEEMKLYHTFFTEEIGISAPLVEMSTRIDDSVIFQLKSEEDKKKTFSKMKKPRNFKWRDNKLELKGISQLSLGKESDKFPLEEALKLLYPLKGIAYGNQLKEKEEASKKVLDSILSEKQADVKMKPIVPAMSTEGNDCHLSFSVEEEFETKRTIFGIRVMSPDKKRTCIVPIEQCLNVPSQMASVVKDFVDQMPECGFNAISQKTSEGNIVGLVLQMTQTGNFIMTIVVPTTKLEQFKQLTPNGVDGDVIMIKNYSKTNETKESMIQKAEKYFRTRGKDKGVLSVYMSEINPRFATLWSSDNYLPDAVHILGDASVPNYYNGKQLQVMWVKEHLINNSVIPILNVIQEWGYLSSDSSICLVCKHKIVSLYLANRVESLTVLCSSHHKNNLQMMKEWASKMGLNKAEFADQSRKRRNKPIRNIYDKKNETTAIIWHSVHKPVLDRLLASGVKDIVLVTYWNKDPPSEFIKNAKEPLEYALEKLEISSIFPIDIAPNTDRFCLLILFHAKDNSLARKRSYTDLSNQSKDEDTAAKRLKVGHN